MGESNESRHVWYPPVDCFVMYRFTIVSGVISIALLIVLSQSHGVLGTAWAIAVGLAIQNLAALYFVKRYLGFFPVG